jgi:HEAT repeat protein
VLLLLDGWDELSAERQEEPITWLDRLLDRYPEIQVIAAAAVEGYEPLQTLAFTLSGLAPWRAYQADQLAAQWAEALGRPGRFRPDTYWQPGQGPLGTTFHLLWQQHAAADDFIPETRAELLSASLPFLLAQGTVEETMKTATLELWQTLAYSLFAEKKLSLSRTTINAWLDTLLATHGIDERHASSLRQSLLQSGLFVQWHDKSYSLLSPVWRNFLAAAYLEAQQQHQNVVDHLQEPYWNGTIRFYTARAGESGLSEWLLDPRSRDPFRAGLFQVASWLPETRDAGEWRRQTLIQLGQLAVKQGAPLALRQRAVAAIAQSGESGILALLRQLLQRADPQLRQAATASLPRFESETSVPILESMMQDDDQDVRVVAVHALGWQNSPLGERPLLIALIGQDEKMSRAAAEELALNRGEGWQILREAATDDAVSVRRVAAYGLGLLDAHWAVELLGEMEVNDDEWAVKSAAGLALEATAARNQQTTWKPQQAGDLAWLVQWAASQERSVPAGAMAINTLCEILETAQQAAIRFAAARSLGQVMIPPQRKDAVLAYLQNAIRRDPDREVREVAFRTLVKLHRAAGQTKA